MATTGGPMAAFHAEERRAFLQVNETRQPTMRRRPGGAVPGEGYKPVDQCNCPCADPHTEALLEAEQNALREAHPMPIYTDEGATSAAWGAEPQPRPQMPPPQPRMAFSAVTSSVSPATWSPVAPPAMPLSAAAVATSVVKGGSMRGAVGGNNVVDAAELQAEQQTATLRNVLQGWGAQSQQDVRVAMAQPPPTESPSVFGPPQQQAVDFDPSAIGADNVDDSSFGF